MYDIHYFSVSYYIFYLNIIVENNKKLIYDINIYKIWSITKGATMSRSHYSISQNHDFIIRGTAKLLNVASSRYGGDWHSVPHTHNHMELFFIVGGEGQFLIEDRLYPVSINNLVIINPNVTHTEVSLNAQPLEYIVLGIDGIELANSSTSNGQFSILNHYESVEVSGCLRNILREMEQKNTGYEDVSQAYIKPYPPIASVPLSGATSTCISRNR